MNLYRGTKVEGLKSMTPRFVNHDKPYVYATTDKVEAIIYSVKGGNLIYTNVYGYDDDGSRCLIERKNNCLESIYSVPGRYYVLDESSFYRHEELGVGDNEYVSEKIVDVIEEISIDNVWKYFKQLESQGKLKIYRYPERPKAYPIDDSDLIECAILMYTQGMNLDDAFSMLEIHHPELKEQIKISKKNICSKSNDEILSKIRHFK